MRGARARARTPRTLLTHQRQPEERVEHAAALGERLELLCAGALVTPRARARARARSRADDTWTRNSSAHNMS